MRVTTEAVRVPIEDVEGVRVLLDVVCEQVQAGEVLKEAVRVIVEAERGQ